MSVKIRVKKTPCCSSDCCCGTSAAERSAVQHDIPAVSTELSFKDILDGWKVRLGLGRMNYLVKPGLYAVGSPNRSSPVFVSANYKLTFDSLRKELSGLDCWLLILDTKGVNVWCAAGKGTFGTGELAGRISATGLSDFVSHRELILPQLGAVGVSAHKVTQQTGFLVVYGPVRARDIKAFIDSDCMATKEMRTVKFTVWDRLVLTPLQLVQTAKPALMVLGVLFLINLFAARPFGFSDFIIGVGAMIAGAVITPVLLPFIPGRAFAWKGWLLGLIWTAGFVGLSGWLSPDNLLLGIGYLLVLPSLSAYIAMDFTGSSTYTSFSGVIKEMKISLPFIISSSAMGVVLLLIKSFIV